MKRRNEHPIQKMCRMCFIVLLVAACLYFVIWQLAEPPIDLDQTDASVLEGLMYTAPDRIDQAVEPEHWYPFDAAELEKTVRRFLPANSMKSLMATIGAEEMSAAAKQHEYAARNGVLSGNA